MTGRPSAWTLRPGHPDLCPGSGQPCLYDACYRNACCETCGAMTGAESAASVPGGGRVADHYPADPPQPPQPPLRCRVDPWGRGLDPGEPSPGPPKKPAPEAPPVLAGQLDLFTPEATDA